MENRPPGPEDTENPKDDAKSAKAEGVAAWLSRQRDQEQHAILGELLKKKDEEEDDDEEEDEKSEKKPRRLKFGAVSIIAGEDKDALPKNTEESEPEQPSLEHTAEEPADQVEADFVQWEQELAAAQAEQEDFDKWEAEIATPDDVAEGHEDRQEEPEERQPGPINSARRAHTPRTAASARPGQATTSGNVYNISSVPPSTNVGGGGGGGGNRPPISGGLHGPNGSFGQGGGMNAIPSSPNVISPPTPDALTAPSPNKLKEHSHEHGHPRLAAATLVGLLIERGFRRRADNEIKREMKNQNEKLQKQNKRNQFIQDQARQSLEARQMQLETEQRRQRQAAEHTPTASVEQVAKQAEVEAQQSPEESSSLSAEERAEARVRQRAVMEQVKTTAENDSSVERVYERRQEVKDEPSNPAGAAAAGAASLGSLLSKSPVAQQATGRAGYDDTYHHSKTGHAGPPDADYRAAAIKGVGAAIAVIILALLAYALL